jgi:hypothetical protein
LYPLGNYVYLIGLENGRPAIHRAPEGTNDWETVYSTSDGRSFRHGTMRIYGDQLFYYLMENKSGSAQPIYLQIYQLAEPSQALLLRGEMDPDGSAIQLKWRSQSGRTYQVFTNDRLDNEYWQNIGEP